MAGRFLAGLLVLLLLSAAPAAAFNSDLREVAFAYEAQRAPLLFTAGALDIDGKMQGTLVAADVNDTRMVSIPQMRVGTVDGDTVEGEEFTDATLVMHSGSLLWRIHDGGHVAMRASPDYALALGLPTAPFGDDQAQSSGLIIAAPELQAILVATSGKHELVLMNATVSILDGSGRAQPGWDRRAVNAELEPGASETPESATLVQTNGPFETQHAGRLIAGDLGAHGDFRITVGPSHTDRFEESIGALSQMGGQGGTLPPESVTALRALAPFINGGALLLRPPEDTGAAIAEARQALIGGQAIESGPFLLLRSHDLAIAWQGDEMRMDGMAVMAASHQGFAVDKPASIGLIPLVVLLLWLIAICAIVWHLTIRPPKGVSSIMLRLIGASVSILTFIGVFWLWDLSFAATFGTSFLTQLAAGGAFESMMMVFAIQMAPWGLAAFAFALPVRIVLGVIARRLGYGKSLKGFATAGGLIALGVLGPAYALWLVNLAILAVTSFI